MLVLVTITAVCAAAVIKTATPRTKYSIDKKLIFDIASLRELLVKVPKILPNRIIVAGYKDRKYEKRDQMRGIKSECHLAVM